jgi:hypothetical protein
MQKWEYRTFKMDTEGFLGGILDTEAFDSALNELGSDGWELVTAFTTSRGNGASREAVAIFKRPQNK